uniref:Uncharacterized protein n=1 Tax=Meloidogyne enterolobii TaxID=390850 RepID=A0A6V7V6C0_MELEN|nr:unnamed protein product [Meloidogyne enterolobii]
MAFGNTFAKAQNGQWAQNGQGAQNGQKSSKWSGEYKNRRSKPPKYYPVFQEEGLNRLKQNDIKTSANIKRIKKNST